ncbi:MAG: glycerol kinase GlpK [Sphaerochaetaceae bacterium]|nr:glycerol kinase GlpK [Sphaerochaetaceae bacterium]MDD4218619.1 glycerol kinase GlpK [Sphaerochaetaceae bacterium]MDY0371261.1 glycerol kinase GlpK [Sphaerochaetaceae bacterium]
MKYVGALDQGTTSTRFILFDQTGSPKASHQIEHQQIFPQPGWVEHNPTEIWKNSVEVISQTLNKVRATAKEVVGIGITNQRETIVAWEPATGKIRYNAIVWQDLRGAELIEELKKTIDVTKLQSHSGLILSPYFSASKIAWLLDHVDGLRSDAEAGRVVFGTIDSFLVWNLTGGANKGVVVTDVTNASRYMLMNITTLEWDDWLLETFKIPRQSLPKIVNSFGEVYGETTGIEALQGTVPVCGILGDQQAALFGQACFTPGQGKSTYGTGCFILINTGDKPSLSSRGLLTTVAFKEAGKDARYALEGSIAVAGSLVQWLRDNLKIVKSAPEVDTLAESVPDCGGVYIVPAFTGLFAPYWRSDARGVIAGLTGFATSAHICRAALEATAFQAKDIFAAMEADSGITMEVLKVDGGLTNSRPLMEFQADLLGIPVIRPQVVETTALGAAYAAGLSCGFWKSFEELGAHWREKSRWEPAMGEADRKQKIQFWNKAVQRTLGWVTADDQ